jgi:hypothetical protein
MKFKYENGKLKNIKWWLTWMNTNKQS